MVQLNKLQNDLRRRILNAKQAITGVTQTGNDVSVPIQLAVNGRSEDRQIGKMSMHHADAFGGGDEIDEAHVFGAKFGQKLHGRHGAAAGSQHGVDQNDLKLRQVAREALVIEEGTQTFFLALQADEADARMGNQLQDGVHHAQSRAQYGHEDD